MTSIAPACYTVIPASRSRAGPQTFACTMHKVISGNALGKPEAKTPASPYRSVYLGHEAYEQPVAYLPCRFCSRLQPSQARRCPRSGQ